MARAARGRGSVSPPGHSRPGTQAGARWAAAPPAGPWPARGCAPVTRRQPWSVQQIRALGVTTDIVTAGAVLGIGRTTAYRLARSGQFPVPVLKAGNRYLVPVAHLLAAVGIEATVPEANRDRH